MKKTKPTKKDKTITFTKRAVIIILALAELQICASYILAFLDKPQIAEALSVQTTITVIGVFLGYAAKALIENLSKNGVFKKHPDMDHLDDNNECAG